MSIKFHILCPGCSTILQQLKSKCAGFRYATLKWMADSGVECDNASCPVHIEGVAELLQKAAPASAHHGQTVDEGMYSISSEPNNHLGINRQLKDALLTMPFRKPK